VGDLRSPDNSSHRWFRRHTEPGGPSRSTGSGHRRRERGSRGLRRVSRTSCDGLVDGIAVYPDENRQKRNYDVTLDDAVRDDAERPAEAVIAAMHELRSDLTWLSESQFAFLDCTRDGCQLVTVDVKTGRGNVARRARANGLRDRHKNRHSAEKRSQRSEEARSRKCCEIGSYEVASLVPASWNQIASWLEQIDKLRRAA